MTPKSQHRFSVAERLKLHLSIVLLCAVVPVAYAQLEEKPIRISGMVSLEVFPGPPNYESVKNGDEAEGALILTAMKQGKKERFQLVVLSDSKQKFATLRHCIGKTVSVEGVVWEAITGHHHTPFLITVKSIQEAAHQP